MWWCESGEGICVWHGNSSHYFPMFLLFIAIYKSQVNDLLQVTPCPTLLRFIGFIVATTPPLFCSASLRPTVITDITTPDKMVTPRCGLEIKGLRGKMRREAASFNRGRARRKGERKKKGCEAKESSAWIQKKRLKQTETHPGGQYMKYFIHSLDNSTFLLPVPRTMHYRGTWSSRPVHRTWFLRLKGFC